MRTIAMAAALGIVLLVAYLAMRTPTRPALAGGRWQVHHYAEAGQTVVAVARMTPTSIVLEQHVVARISDADPTWSAQFLLAKQEAEERAFHLNAEP